VGVEILERMADEVFQKENPAEIKYKGRTQQVIKEGEDYILVIAMPFINKEELSLNQKGDQLIVRAGAVKRNITLPRTLVECSIKKAKFDEEALKIWFGSEKNE
jgi:arsenite-transporting ATPase